LFCRSDFSIQLASRWRWTPLTGTPTVSPMVCQRKRAPIAHRTRMDMHLRSTVLTTPYLPKVFQCLSRAVDDMKCMGRPALSILLLCVVFLFPREGLAFDVDRTETGNIIRPGQMPLAVYWRPQAVGKLTSTQIETAIMAAIASWNDVSDSRVVLHFGGQVTKPPLYDIYITFDSAYDGSGGDITGRADRIHDDSGKVSRVEIALNAAPPLVWSLNPAAPFQTGELADLQGALTHHLGHAIGLGHSRHRYSVMYFYRTDAGQRVLSEDDRRGARFLWPTGQNLTSGNQRACPTTNTAIQNPARRDPAACASVTPAAPIRPQATRSSTSAIPSPSSAGARSGAVRAARVDFACCRAASSSATTRVHAIQAILASSPRSACPAPRVRQPASVLRSRADRAAWTAKPGIRAPSRRRVDPTDSAQHLAVCCRSASRARAIATARPASASRRPVAVIPAYAANRV